MKGTACMSMMLMQAVIFEYTLFYFMGFRHAHFVII